MVPGAVWYATGYLHSPCTAAEHSILAFFGGFCPPWTAAPKRLSQWSGRHGTGTSWLQLVAVVCGAVWYATGYLHSPYTAAEHSILAFFWGVLPSVDRGIETALSVVR